MPPFCKTPLWGKKRSERVRRGLPFSKTPKNAFPVVTGPGFHPLPCHVANPILSSKARVPCPFLADPPLVLAWRRFSALSDMICFFPCWMHQPMGRAAPSMFTISLGKTNLRPPRGLVFFSVLGFLTPFGSPVSFHPPPTLSAGPVSVPLFPPPLVFPPPAVLLPVCRPLCWFGCRRLSFF